MIDELVNKVVWITGAGRGIGAATAKKFIDRGSIVVASSTREFNDYVDLGFYPDEFKQIDNFLYLKCDIRNQIDINSIYAQIIARFGTLDILINNAGIGVFKPFTETSIEEFDDLMSINVRGAFLCIKSVLENMLNNQSGTIVNISSVAVVENFANCSIYNASKSALLAMSRSLRNEVRQHGIKLLDFIPGATYTDIWDEKSKLNFKANMISPDDLANVILWNVAASIKGNLMVEEIIIRPQNGNL